MVADGDARAGDVARRRAHMPDGTRAILDTRSLQSDHRRLAALPRPRLPVLDVGCGTGAITRGIAEAGGHEGHAGAVDVNAARMDAAPPAHPPVPGLACPVVDAHGRPFRG